MNDSDNDNTSEIYEAANTAQSYYQINPQKSRKIFLKQYELFMEWMQPISVENFKEVFLEFFWKRPKFLNHQRYDHPTRC